MRWKGREQSSNVEDRRGISPKVAVGGGGIGLLLIVGIAMLLGADPKMIQGLLQQQQQQGQQNGAPNQAAGKNDEAREFLAVVLRDTETVWADRFRQEFGAEYNPPKLVIFSDEVSTACGRTPSAVGPFYCPGDDTVYIDPTFFDELKSRHRAPGDFAQAYVIAHEVGHHVQGILGYMDEVNRVRQRGNKIESNKASVRLELQADYLAGVWAHHAHRQYNILEEGDIEEAINAANQIGDDTLMKEAGAYVIPERFTHGTSKQRVYWFTQGLKSGDMRSCKVLFEVDYDQL
jgi:predicted metalloprotease